MGLVARKSVIGGLQTTKAQISRIPSLISAFVICLLGSIISQPTTSRLSIFLLVSEAEQDGLSLAIREIPKTGFLAMRPIFKAELRRYANATI